MLVVLRTIVCSRNYIQTVSKPRATGLMNGIIKVLNLVKNKTQNPQATEAALKQLTTELSKQSTLNKISDQELENYKDIIRRTLADDSLDPDTVNLDGWF